MSLRIVLLASLVWSVIASDNDAIGQSKVGNAVKAGAKVPAPPALALGRVASNNSLIFLTSNGWKTPDPKSKNKTEQLCAEKSVQEFFHQLIDEIKKAVDSQQREGDEEAEVLSKALPVMISAAIEHPLAVSLESFTISPFRPEANLAIVIDTEKDAGKVGEALEQLIGLTPDEGPAALIEETIEGATFYHPDVPDDAELVIPHFGMYKSYLIFTLGQNMVQRTIEKLDESKKAPEWLEATLGELKVERPTVAFYIDFQGIWKTVDPLITIPPVRGALSASGLMDLNRVALVSGLDPIVSVSKAVIETNGPPKGLLALFPDQPLTAADLKGIPVDPVQAHVVRFDLELLVDAVLKITEPVRPGIRNQYEATSAQLEGVVGFSVKDDLFKAIGDVWSLYIAQETGGGAVPEAILTVSVRDSNKMTKVHDFLIQLAKQLLGQRANLEEFKANKNQGYQLHINNMTVAWLITNDQIVVGLNSDLVKAHLSRYEGKESLANNQEIQAAMKRDPKTVLLSYHDPKHEIQAVYKLVNQLSPLLLGGLQSQGIDFNLPELPPIEDLQRHLSPSVSTLSRTSKGWSNEWQGVLPSVGSASPAIVAVGVALFLPAVQQARSAARRTQSKNNLKQIGLAMHNHHDVFNQFPDRVITDKKDKPLLSWRVKILPFLDQAALYNEFHLDEPWDSEHNKKLIERMPSIYASPDSPELAKEFKTRYVVPVAEGTPFGDDDGPKIRDITDGTSNTILVLEANAESAVVWSQPDDLEIDFDDPLDGVVGTMIGGFHALMCDGAVRFISQNIDVKTFKALLTKAGGEVIGDF